MEFMNAIFIITAHAGLLILPRSNVLKFLLDLLTNCCPIGKALNSLLCFNRSLSIIISLSPFDLATVVCFFLIEL